MDEEKNEETNEETSEETNEETSEETSEESEDNREEETTEEIRDEVYVNDDEIEMLRSIEKRFDVLEEKLDNAISMFVDSGAIVQERIDDEISDDYEEDFIDIDDLNLKL